MYNKNNYNYTKAYKIHFTNKYFYKITILFEINENLLGLVRLYDRVRYWVRYHCYRKNPSLVKEIGWISLYF